MPHRIMAHMVAFFPDREGSLETARALVDGGASCLEVQFPFSDPTADGPAIQEACRTALASGFKSRSGFSLVGEIRRMTAVPVFVMGYANTVFFHGVGRFVGALKESGADGIIVPDLPPDYDEGLFDAGSEAGIEVVPVIAPAIGEERLEMILSGVSKYLYAALRRGITGAYTEIGDGNIAFLQRAGRTGKLLLGGFGISERRQVEALAPHVHAAVVGSAFIRAVLERGRSSVYEAVAAKMRSLA